MAATKILPLSNLKIDVENLLNSIIDFFITQVYNRKFFEKSATLDTKITAILDKIKFTQKSVRFLHHPITVLKQSLSIIEKGQIKNREISKFFKAIADIVIQLRITELMNGYKIDKLIDQLISFYNTKFDELRKNGINLFKQEQLKVSEPEPDDEYDKSAGIPQGKSMSWYKRYGLAKDIRKKILIPQSGKYKGEKLEVVKLNGNNTLFKSVENGIRKYISCETSLKWEEKQPMTEIKVVDK